MKELILGGARSGKSARAEQLAQASGLEVVYLATATAGDGEMARRIEQHRARRPAHWQTVEEPLALARALRRHATARRCLIVDCLTLWLTNQLLHDDGAQLAQQRRELVALVERLPGWLIFVSNEVNMGVVPMDALSRRFCDEAGWLHQQLAARCERVTLMVAGLPLFAKGGDIS